MISFVVPIFNEQDNILIFYQKLTSLISSRLRKQSYEIIFINDGSTDSSTLLLQTLQSKDNKVRLLSLRKNSGKATALRYGFSNALGELVVTMDGDLQDGPENIPAMLSKLKQGYDLVVGWRRDRHDPRSKLISSKIFNLLVRSLTGIKLHDFNCGIKVMRQPVAKSLNLYGELHRFLPVLAALDGFKVGEIVVTHHPRIKGKSKYGLTRMFGLWFDFLTIYFLDKFGQRPLHLFGLLGMVALTLGVGFAGYLSILHFMGEQIGRRPLLILAVLLILSGFQMLSIGLIAEVIVNKKSLGSDDKCSSNPGEEYEN